MVDLNYSNIRWRSLECTESNDQEFTYVVQDQFLKHHVLKPTGEIEF